MKITYHDSLYDREAIMIVEGPIEFRENGIAFSAMGQKLFLEYQYIIRIEEAT